MPTLTQKYELMVILDPSVSEHVVTPTLDKYLAVVKNDKGTIDNVDVWGRRQLAYPINKKTEGTYVVVQFTSPTTTVAELDRVLGLSEAVLRAKVLRAEDAHVQLRKPRKA